MSQSHILFFNRAFYPEISATSQLLNELAQDLQKQGFQITVIAGMPMGPQESDRPLPSQSGLFFLKETWDSVSIVRVRGTTISKKTFVGRSFNYLVYFFLACAAGIRSERPDVVIALTDPPIAGLAALLTARRFRCPWVISFRDLFPEVGRLLGNKGFGPIHWCLTQVNRIIIGRATRIIALGEDMRHRLVEEKGADPDRVVLIRDWADNQKIQLRQKQNSFSEMHKLTDKFVVMHAGNIGLSQDLDYLIQAAGRLKELSDLTLLFVGDGVKKDELKTQVDQSRLQNVQFLPYQPWEKVSDVFASADCFVISLKPGLAGYITPSKLYSILAAGRPYVASVEPFSDVALITRTYHCGLLAEPQNPESLADQIQKLYQDRELLKQLGENAHQASKEFSRSSGAQAYASLCKSLMET